MIAEENECNYKSHIFTDPLSPGREALKIKTVNFQNVVGVRTLCMKLHLFPRVAGVRATRTRPGLDAPVGSVAHGLMLITISFKKVGIYTTQTFLTYSI